MALSVGRTRTFTLSSDTFRKKCACVNFGVAGHVCVFSGWPWVPQSVAEALMLTRTDMLAAIEVAWLREGACLWSLSETAAVLVHILR